MIVSIILNILKIIGFILLGIFGFVLVLFLAVLFVPVRYKVCAGCDMDERKKEYQIKVRFSWLLGFIRMKGEHPGEDGFVIKAGPFSVFGSKKRKKKTVPHKKNGLQDRIKEKKKRSSVTIEGGESIPQKAKEELKETEYEKSDEPVQEDVSKNDKKRRSLKEKIILTRDRFCDKIKKIWKRLRDIVKDVEKYHAILKSEQFLESFSLCKHSLKRFFKMIKPAKVRADLKAGFSDPEKTGYLCAAVGVISPFFGKQHIHIEPDFEKFMLKGNAMVKGKIYVFVVLYIGLKLYFDKNIRKVMDMFQKEEMTDE